MNRRVLVEALGTAIPASISVPRLNAVRAQERGKVKITDVEVMRVQMKGHVMPLVKIETAAGAHGIAECHHDVTGLGVKDVVLNAIRQMLIGQDPFAIERLTSQPRNRLDPASCKEWADYIRQSAQKWTAARTFRWSRRRTSLTCTPPWD